MNIEQRFIRRGDYAPSKDLISRRFRPSFISQWLLLGSGTVGDDDNYQGHPARSETLLGALEALPNLIAIAVAEAFPTDTYALPAISWQFQRFSHLLLKPPSPNYHRDLVQPFQRPSLFFDASLPFVHTARRSYRSDKLVIELDEELGC